jgi:hypothetical protein
MALGMLHTLSALDREEARPGITPAAGRP